MQSGRCLAKLFETTNARVYLGGEISIPLHFSRSFHWVATASDVCGLMEEKKVHAGKPSFASTSWRCGEIILLSLWLKLDWWFACKFIWLVWTEFPKEGRFLSRRTHKTIMWPFKKVQFGPTLARFFPDSVWDYKQEKQIKWKAAFPGSGPGGIIQITFFFLAPSFERPSFEFSSQNGLGMVISPLKGQGGGGGAEKKERNILHLFQHTCRKYPFFFRTCDFPKLFAIATVYLFIAQRVTSSIKYFPSKKRMKKRRETREEAPSQLGPTNGKKRQQTRTL